MSRYTTLFTARRCLTWGFLLTLTVVGCGPPTASVSGRVKFNGQPLPSGTVVFYGADGRIEHALLARDGSYSVANAPLGAVQITVQSHPAMPIGLPTSGKPPASSPTAYVPPANKEKRDGKSVVIPQRYVDAEKSGLTYTVRAGSQTHDIELKP